MTQGKPTLKPCLQRLQTIIKQYSGLQSWPSDGNPDALILTDELFSNGTEKIYAQLLNTNEITLAFKFTDALETDNPVLMNEVYEFLLDLTKKEGISLWRSENNSFAVGVRFACKFNLTELESELERNLNIIRHFYETHNEEINEFLECRGFLDK